jgi:hypothetical protein
MKITKTVAEALASRVAKQIEQDLKSKKEHVEQAVVSSKEFKLIQKMYKQINQLNEDIYSLEKAIAKNHSSKFYSVQINVRSEATGTIRASVPYVYIRPDMPRHENIVNDILIEGAFADSSTSVDNFVEQLTKRYL